MLARRRRSLFWLAIVGTVLTWPVITLIADFPTNTSDAFVNADNRALASVFYIPSYLLLALLMGVGALVAGDVGAGAVAGGRGGERSRGQPGRPAAAGRPPAAGPAAPSARGLAVAVAVVDRGVPLALAVVRAPDLTMHRYRFADAYIHNVFSVASPHSLVMVDRDQFGFPLIVRAGRRAGSGPTWSCSTRSCCAAAGTCRTSSDQHPALIAGSRARSTASSPR